MVLDENIPDAVEREDVRRIYRERFPNYCPECAGEIVVAGGRVNPEEGWYEHLDPVLTCERGACVQWRMTAGVDQDDGQELRTAPGADEWDHFDGVQAFCDIHRELMVPTKNLVMDDRPTRQYKCPECDREAVVVATSEHPPN